MCVYFYTPELCACLRVCMRIFRSCKYVCIETGFVRAGYACMCEHSLRSCVLLQMVNVHVVIINLVCRQSRRKRILSLSNKLAEWSSGQKFEIVDIHLLEAVDGVSQSFFELEKRYGLKPFRDWPMDQANVPSTWKVGQTSGGIASGLSHLDVGLLMSLKVDAGDWSVDDLVLVMEDDCVLVGNDESCWDKFQQCVADANTHVPNWHMLLLGASGHRADISPSIPITSLVEYPGFSYLTTMYFLTYSGCLNLVKNRSICLKNALPFDELHNALARTNQIRKDVLKVYSKTQKLVLLSSVRSMVKQDPFDCVHDTAVSAKHSAHTHTTQPSQVDNLTAHPINFPSSKCQFWWWRRKICENVQSELFSQTRLSTDNYIHTKPATNTHTRKSLPNAHTRQPRDATHPEHSIQDTHCEHAQIKHDSPPATWEPGAHAHAQEVTHTNMHAQPTQRHTHESPIYAQPPQTYTHETHTQPQHIQPPHTHTKRSFLQELLAHREVEKLPVFPKSFDQYYNDKRRKRYGDDLHGSVLFRE